MTQQPRDPAKEPGDVRARRDVAVFVARRLDELHQPDGRVDGHALASHALAVRATTARFEQPPQVADAHGAALSRRAHRRRMATARPRIEIATPRRYRDALQRASSTRAETTRRRRRRGRAMSDQRPPSPRLSEAALRRHAAAMRGERERAARAASALRRELDDFTRHGPKHDLETPLHAACEDGEADRGEGAARRRARRWTNGTSEARRRS